jgi:hypothetical protein
LLTLLSGNRSHIFTRLFSQHPELSQIWHPYVMNAFLGPDRIVARLRHPEDRQREVMVDMAPMFVPEMYGSESVMLEKQVAEIERAVRVASINRSSIVTTELFANTSCFATGKIMLGQRALRNADEARRSIQLPPRPQLHN